MGVPSGHVDHYPVRDPPQMGHGSPSINLSGTTASIDEHVGHVAKTSPSCMSMPKTSSPEEETHHDLNLGSLRALRLWRQDLARSMMSLYLLVKQLWKHASG